MHLVTNLSDTCVRLKVLTAVNSVIIIITTPVIIIKMIMVY